MKTTHLTVAALAVTALLSGCGTKTETTTATQTSTTMTTATGNAPDADMGNMAMPAEAKMAKSSGMVTAIDKAAGKITLDHKAIPEANWPPMTMTFAAKPAILDGVAVGDKVAFDVTIQGKGGEVTAITKQ